MRISDWSSDVCSSDLGFVAAAQTPQPTVHRQTRNNTHSSHEFIVHMARIHLLAKSRGDRRCAERAAGERRQAVHAPLGGLPVAWPSGATAPSPTCLHAFSVSARAAVCQKGARDVNNSVEIGRAHV